MGVTQPCALCVAKDSLHLLSTPDPSQGQRHSPRAEPLDLALGAEAQGQALEPHLSRSGSRSSSTCTWL